MELLSQNLPVSKSHLESHLIHKTGPVSPRKPNWWAGTWCASIMTPLALIIPCHCRCFLIRAIVGRICNLISWGINGGSARSSGLYLDPIMTQESEQANNTIVFLPDFSFCLCLPHSDLWLWMVTIHKALLQICHVSMNNMHGPSMHRKPLI